MWQLTFRLPEAEARALSAAGAEALRAEALRRCGGWHEPVPTLLRRTAPALITGYPVYDHEPLRTGAAAGVMVGRTALFRSTFRLNTGLVCGGTRAPCASGLTRTLRAGAPQGSPGRLVTLLGDAAHSMSPLKGQGANQVGSWNLGSGSFPCGVAPACGWWCGPCPCLSWHFCHAKHCVRCSYGGSGQPDHLLTECTAKGAARRA
eukprot:SAG11_NODE_123_length_15805_cov_15.133261_16_plen_205_part_00